MNFGYRVRSESMVMTFDTDPVHRAALLLVAKTERMLLSSGSPMYIHNTNSLG